MTQPLAAEGGQPVNEEFIPLCRPWIGDDEKAEVLDTLNGMWLSKGPKVARFEADFRQYLGAHDAVAVSSCTAALHVALVTIGVKEGDEVITTPITFPATTNAILYERATPVLADIDRETLNVDPETIERCVGPKTKAIIPVHLAGSPCDMDAIMAIARQHNLVVIEDAAHAIGATYGQAMVGNIGDMGTFSFYASKNLCTGDGGMISVRDNPHFAEQARILSLHGMSSAAWKRYSKEGAPQWELLYPGFKYNMTDIEASLGIHQLRKIDRITRLRREWASRYTSQLADVPGIELPRVGAGSAWHLFVVLLDVDQLMVTRDRFLELLKHENVGAGIHFVSVHRQRYYRERFGYADRDYPNAAWVSDRLLSLPLFPQMTALEVDGVVAAVKKVVFATRKWRG